MMTVRTDLLMISCDVAPSDAIERMTVDGLLTPSIGAGASLGPDGAPRIVLMIHDGKAERGVAVLDGDAFTQLMDALIASSQICANFKPEMAAKH